MRRGLLGIVLVVVVAGWAGVSARADGVAYPQTIEIAAGLGGAAPNGRTFSADISADGSTVVFLSRASNLVPDDDNGVADVFAFDMKTHTTKLVSLDPNGNQFVYDAQDPTVSGDGRFVAFIANASRFSPQTAVFARDRLTGLTRRVDVSADGRAANDWPNAAVISSNGDWVAFSSKATNLVPGDTNGKQDVFVKQLSTGFIERVSVDESGQQVSGSSNLEDISGDGRFVLFLASHLDLRDRLGGTTTSVDPPGCAPPLTGKLSDDGRWVGAGMAQFCVGSSAPQSFLLDRQSGNWNSDFKQMAVFEGLSADGRYVLLNNGSNTFRFDTASRSFGPWYAPNAGGAAISASGNTVVYLESTALDAFVVQFGPEAVPDGNPPTLTLSHQADGLNGWNIHPGVIETVQASDVESGLVGTPSCTVDGAPAVLAPAASGTWTLGIDGDGVHPVACTATDSATNEATASDTVSIDTTAPATVDDAPDGWSNQVVAVYLNPSDETSGVATTYFSIDGGPPQAGSTFAIRAPADHSDDGDHTISYYSIDNAGNVEAAHTVAVRIDTTPPTITAQPDRPANVNGWYDGPVTVSFACSDALSGISTCPSAATVGEGAGQSVNGTATDAAGNTANVSLGDINIDETPPTITFSGNADSYTVDQTMNITCLASDSLSGLNTSTCPSASGAAYSFGVGSTTLSATATDHAGNTSSGSTSFTVVVTSKSLDNLINQFFGGDTDRANGLIAKVILIASAPNASAKDGALRAYDNEVDAKAGKPLTPEQATLLKQLAAAL